MELVIFLVIGIVVGFGVMWMLSRGAASSHARTAAELESKTAQNISLIKQVSALEAQGTFSSEKIAAQGEEILRLKDNVHIKAEENTGLEKLNSELRVVNRTLSEKLDGQKGEIENIRKEFKLEFENVANRILEDNSKRFTELNKENIGNLLRPLGENIENFRKKVDETYDRESKERFSLGREVEKLVELNKRISEEANNLTNALRGNSKVQGDWGEMILENILEKSGLVKGREYVIQETLRDEVNNTLKGEDGRRMIPDVVVKYPDGRNVVIDSKVSLSAYVAYCSDDDPAECKRYLAEHVASVKRHIDELSKKSYHEYTESLDFVMMFVPNDPAFMLALQSEPDLWNYAYRKGVLLLSPTNLIAALKLIEDLWSREYQTQNAIKIAEAGARLYDKFVGFTENMARIGDHIRKTEETYNEAMGQLRDGKGNLITRVEGLKKLGVKAKKSLPAVDDTFVEDDADGEPSMD